MAGGEQVLVTGASGYIAAHVIQQLQQAGYRVRGTVRDKNDQEKIKHIRELCEEAKHPVDLVVADLTKDDGWTEAVKGCDYVMHVASPVKPDHSKHEDEIVKPEVDGILRVLGAIRSAKSVKRCIITTSIITAFGSLMGENGVTYDETKLTNTEKPGLDSFTKSKALAERAAFDFVASLPEDERFELVVLNPGFVFGPIFSDRRGPSVDFTKALLQRQMPFLPQLPLFVVDVRDVARAHVTSLTADGVVGHRHLLCSQCLWFKDFAQILSDEFKPQGYNVPTRIAPNWLMWIISCFDKGMKTIYPHLNSMPIIDNSRMKNVLGINPIEPRKSFIDMAYNMIERGLVKKTSQYKSPRESKV